MDLEKIWSEYKYGLKAFLHSKISNDSDVEDLLQDILIKTFKNIHTLNSEESIKSWIYQIARNSVVDFYRKNKINNVVFEEFEHSFIEEKEEVQTTLSKCIRPFLNSLSNEDKELLTAIDLEGVSQKQYAENNNLNYSTVKSRIKKSREALRSTYENCCKISFDSQGNLSDFDQKLDTCKKC